ncbi:MAG: hypothetical protein P4L50_28435 [Anaerolineaceae bacterium]|nr:hypothetical protein [Anaerolineaceae bacterium]
MNQQTRNILQRSLLLINDYRYNKISLQNLVSSLEGSLNALEEQLPEEFYKLWYTYWGNLEIALALGINADTKQKIIGDLEELENTINKQLLE